MSGRNLSYDLPVSLQDRPRVGVRVRRIRPCGEVYKPGKREDLAEGKILAIESTARAPFGAQPELPCGFSQGAQCYLVLH